MGGYNGPMSVRSEPGRGLTGVQGEHTNSVVRAGSEREIMSCCVVSQLEK